MLSVSARRASLTCRRFMSQTKMQQGASLTSADMKKSKNHFVAFVNRATLDKTSPEKKEMYEYLVQCFTNADSDYDGLVSFKGFNNMIGEAATAPRRFGFAPHTREMYFTKEDFETERQALYNKLRANEERVSLEQWLGWANAHIKEKVGNGLEEHDLPRWERTQKDYVQFYKDVMKEKSTMNPKSTSSTQYKEHYMNSVQEFCAADVAKTGKLDLAAFNNLVYTCAKVPTEFGLNLYQDWDFKTVAKGKNFVSMQDFLAYKLAYLKRMVADKM